MRGARKKRRQYEYSMILLVSLSIKIFIGDYFNLKERKTKIVIFSFQRNIVEYHFI